MNGDTLYADPKLAAYRRGDAPLPSSYWLWPLYGAGLENLGRDEQPIQVPTPACGPDQLLVRHDAVGLCFSDTKVIKAGETHPRLGGRDMKANPVVLGHEVALTVLRVGDNLKDRYQPGQRFIIQADIYYKGVGLAYGYVLQGGLSQYNVVGPEVLDGDEGSYLLPMQLQTGYAQAALTEPWACVVASYTVEYRSGWKPGGVALIVATSWARPIPAASRRPRSWPWAWVARCRPNCAGGPPATAIRWSRSKARPSTSRCWPGYARPTTARVTMTSSCSAPTPPSTRRWSPWPARDVPSTWWAPRPWPARPRWTPAACTMTP